MIKFVKKNIIYILIAALITGVFFYFAHAKAGYYIDEIYTYGLSNSHFAPYLSDVAGGDLEDRVITNNALKSYVVVDDGEVLDVASVYYNQEADVHPPLYYWLFNIASSVTPNVFSKWTGLVLDYIIYAAAIAVLAVICQELFDNKFTTYTAIILYGISYAGISTAVYIRMYCLLTLLTLVLVFFVIKLIRTKKVKFCIFSGITILAGMMTQYYFVFYAFFVSASVCIYFLIKKEYSILWKYAICSIAGVLLMVAVFPASIKHIFVGNGQVVSGAVAADNLFDVSQWISRVIKYTHFVIHGIKASVVVGAIAFVFLAVTRRFRKCDEVLVVFIPAVLTWLVIALIAAVQEERYIYNILPIFIIAVAYLLSHLHLYYVPIICITALALSYTGCNVDYLQPRTLLVNEILSGYSDSKCVYLTDNKFAAMTSDYYELINFNDVFTTSDATSKQLKKYIGDAEEVIVFIDSNEEWSSGLDPETEMREISESTGLNDYEKILDNTLSVVYVLR